MGRQENNPPTLAWNADSGTLFCHGDWTWTGLSAKSPAFPSPTASRVALDTSGVTAMDTAGALALRRYLNRLEAEERTIDHTAIETHHRTFLDLVGRHHARPDSRRRSRRNPLHVIGEATASGAARISAFFAFIGTVAADSLPLLLKPHRIRWRQIVAEIDHAGVRALPILGLLIFLTGVVIAYQGGTPLQQYGANIFLVDLLTLTMLREMAPLMTAIIVAGRTGSSYTAQIGTMRITDEVDALRVIGITPNEMLVFPKLLALIIVMPLLTLFANVFGMLGGMTVAAIWFDVGYTEFLQRMPEVVAASSFWVGIIKAPVFAVLIVMVSCYHGFSVQGSTESVGRATTQSVVQGIFLVIVADAIFSIVFNVLNL